MFGFIAAPVWQRERLVATADTPQEVCEIDQMLGDQVDDFAFPLHAAAAANRPGREDQAPLAVVGRDRIIRLETGVLRKLKGQFTLRLAEVNGRAGTMAFLDGRPFAVTSFETDGRQILSVMRVLNPDKLFNLSSESGVAPTPLVPRVTENGCSRRDHNSGSPFEQHAAAPGGALFARS
jgi:hypothetical protein